MKIEYLILLFVTVFVSSCEQEGCMDSAALNYNSEATEDDGSCEYAQPGCMDPNSLNYDPNATVHDGSCNYESENYIGVYTVHDSMKHVFSSSYEQGTREIIISLQDSQPSNLLFTNMFFSGFYNVYATVANGHFDSPDQTILALDGTPTDFQISYVFGHFVGDSIYYKFIYTNPPGDPHFGGGSGKRQ